MQGVVLVFSLEGTPLVEKVKNQLKSMEYWLEQLSDSSKCYNDEMAFVLIGNKSDVPTKESIAKDSEVDKHIKNWCQ